MRKGNHNTLIEQDGEFVGVNLGWDFTAEHEWGIEKLTGNFGISGVQNGLFNKRLGIDARQVTKISPHLRLHVKGNFTYLISYHSYGKDVGVKRELDRVIDAHWKTWKKDQPEITLQTAWDSNTFGVATQGKEGRKHLKELFNAFLNNDAAITFGYPGSPFGNTGLLLLIVSKLSQEYLEALTGADLDAIALVKASKKTGIIKRLEKAGRKYYTCAPRWANDEKTKVEYWLNPQEQKKYSSHWMTVADLDDWIAGKGKAMKEPG